MDRNKQTIYYRLWTAMGGPNIWAEIAMDESDSGAGVTDRKWHAPRCLACIACLACLVFSKCVACSVWRDVGGKGRGRHESVGHNGKLGGGWGSVMWAPGHVAGGWRCKAGKHGSRRKQSITC